MRLLVILIGVACVVESQAQDDEVCVPKPTGWCHGFEGSQGCSNANLQCQKKDFVIVVNSPANIRRVRFQLGTQTAQGQFVPSVNPNCRCVTPAPANEDAALHSACNHNWQQEPANGNPGAGVPLVPEGPGLLPEENPNPLSNTPMDLYFRSANRLSPSSSFTVDFAGECVSSFESFSPDSFSQVTYIRVTEYLATDVDEISRATETSLLLECDYTIVQPPPTRIVVPEPPLVDVAVCREVAFSIVASTLPASSELPPQQIQVDISRTPLMAADTQYSWIVKSLKYHNDVVVANNLASSPVGDNIATKRQLLNAPEADTFRIQTDFVVLEDALDLPISAVVTFTAAAAGVVACPALS